MILCNVVYVCGGEDSAGRGKVAFHRGLVSRDCAV